MSGCQIGWCRFLHKRAESYAGTEFLCLAACWLLACWPSHAYLSFLATSPAWDLEAGRPTAVKNILLSPGLGLISGYSLPRLWLAKGRGWKRRGWKSKENHWVFLFFRGKLGFRVSNLVLCRFGFRLGPVLITCDFQSQKHIAFP